MSQQTCHETAADIFKGQCRTVEQFEAVDVIVDVYHRSLERQRVFYDLIQGTGIDVFTKECLCHSAGDFVERLVLHIADRILV